jgi:uncharacterized membrane protein
VTARSTFLVSVVCLLAALVCAAYLLPDEVPLHFDGSGDPDHWGSRTEALVTMGAVGLLLALVLGGTAALTERMPVSLLNVPHKDWWTATPDREQRMRQMMRTDLYALGAATMLLVALAVVGTVVAARSDEPALGPFVYVGLGCYLVFVAAWTVWSLRTRYRRRDDA